MKENDSQMKIEPGQIYECIEPVKILQAKTGNYKLLLEGEKFIIVRQLIFHKDLCYILFWGQHYWIDCCDINDKCRLL
jgi:hypothetical protein